ncbi:type II toxin-antitoxin system RelE/ParE family toxin [Rhizobium sp. P40RR-XXII]|uniref:type II toxin-antitoxin system RelE/ParE family toxin n=1 Tax=unclassified Rhizobium TaxID=2613769 RepID=UPI001456926C|nr:MULTISPECIES: type II toxin-antitoxin system RelE/ParE family toxin [unclassified Rhizobium]NLR87179.1 type II toxin-antitoxin system RelE/ParE family toxin [Rhizobium sp. P28RR-XV]NLS19649.1 type II toxin-antitoxin system RelE/ParE family toxin [Rhizobium sp. P40RR-XXII]
MKYRVVFSALAEDDLINIYEFIAKDSPSRALSFIQRLQEQCKTLKIMADRGPQRESLGPGVRIMVFERRVTAAYLIKNEQVVILRLFYAGQNISSTLLDEH